MDDSLTGKPRPSKELAPALAAPCRMALVLTAGCRFLRQNPERCVRRDGNIEETADGRWEAAKSSLLTLSVYVYENAMLLHVALLPQRLSSNRCGWLTCQVAPAAARADISLRVSLRRGSPCSCAAEGFASFRGLRCWHETQLRNTQREITG